MATFAVVRNVGLYAQYTYYRYELPIGPYTRFLVRTSSARQIAMVGLTLSVPIFRHDAGAPGDRRKAIHAGDHPPGHVAPQVADHPAGRRDHQRRRRLGASTQGRLQVGRTDPDRPATSATEFRLRRIPYRH